MNSNNPYGGNHAYLDTSVGLQTMVWHNWYYWMNRMNSGGSYWFYPKGRSMTYAKIKGGPLAPHINGMVYFIDVPGGTEVCINVSGLPPYQPATKDKDPIGPHGFHIHEVGICEVGDPKEPFQSAGEHWNPDNQPHGNHASDFPVIFSNNGSARMCFFTNRFKPWDVIGKSVLIHESPDDYRTQPAGDAGRRLACGVIQ
ncbi:superoxide dismutase family protein [Alkaliphilus peptidifermentans]|uniref:Superoxide dismutase [Cu-Zn] n=1 Tax=Alkaliphilus peptidifermentans DSM 18978 TaxID=1120976 RepID=A0A1G5L0D9_9FIRM|nr:superoxide dismutase family protein [Alkaliphilus peptidifermentans]SCZ05891.1 superoxide dismutase, Cu-Zn family [Alkaliphilus peptidifermentans DSM 18978]